MPSWFMISCCTCAIIIVVSSDIFGDSFSPSYQQDSEYLSNRMSIYLETPPDFSSLKCQALTVDKVE